MEGNSVMKKMLHALKIWYVIDVDITICLFIIIHFTFYYINYKDVILFLLLH